MRSWALPLHAHTGPQAGSLPRPPARLQPGAGGGGWGMLRGVSCRRLPWFPTSVVVISGSPPHPLVYLMGSRLPTALWVFSWRYFRDESILRNLLTVLTFVPYPSLLKQIPSSGKQHANARAGSSGLGDKRKYSGCYSI